MEAWSTVAAALVLFGAAAVPLADQTPFAGESGADASQTHHVHIEDFDMDPLSLQIEAGDSVTWHNHDSASHTATDDDGSWDTGTLSTDETKTITFDDVAEFSYHCEVHPDSMTGYTLEVVEPNEPPTVSIDAPTEGEKLSGATTIEGTASDPDGSVETVEVRVDGGEWRTAEGTSDWSLSWDTQQVADGEHTIEARSFDGSDHSETATVNVTTENPHPDLAVTHLDAEAGLTSTTVTATVDNQGETEANATSLEVRYAAENAGGVVGTQAMPALAVDETHEVSMTWDTADKVGQFELTARVDPADEVLDFTPDNDERSETVCVPGAEGATCAIPGTEAPG